MTRNEWLALAAGGVLLALAVVRIGTPEAPRLRPLSIEGIEIPPERIGAGGVLERERVWTAPTDVYVTSWSPLVRARGSRGELILMLQGTKTVLFRYVEDGTAPRTESFAPGAAFLVRAGEHLVLRFRIANNGETGDTGGASALIHFVPAAGN